MSQNTYQLTGKAVEVYEFQKVKAIFRPLAEATLQNVTINENDSVLDVACGTGIMNRVIGEQFPSLNSIVGVDLNPTMIEMAKKLTSDQQERFKWHQSDVVSLPFEDKLFTLVFCQQGLQFFPDKPKAIQEIRRVIKPNGRLVLTVWSAISPFFMALAESLDMHIGSETAQKSLAPFAFRDEQVIRDIVTGAGFIEASMTTITILRNIDPANISIPKEIAANPIGSTVAAQEQDVVNRIIKQVEMAIEPYRTDTGYAIPQETFLLQARA